MGVNFGAAVTTISDNWIQFKESVTIFNLNMRAKTDDGNLLLFAPDNNLMYYCFLYDIVPQHILDKGYSQEQNDLDKIDYTENWLNRNLVNKKTINSISLAKFSDSIPITSDGKLRIASEKSDQNKATYYTFDWTDKTTWYQDSVEVISGSLTDSGDHKTYIFPNQYLIDNYHSKISQEDYLLDKDGKSLRVSVFVSGSTLIEQDPHFESGGDYIINYSSGTLTFINEQNPTASFHSTYHYSNTSLFTLKPDERTSLIITSVEAQFSDDIIMTDTVKFELYGFVDIFAPHLLDRGVPSGTKIPLISPIKYKSFTDLQNETSRAYPPYPAMGGNNWRASPHQIYVFDWDYVSSIVLRSDYGMEIRMSLEHDKPFDGWYATVTFYCITENL